MSVDFPTFDRPTMAISGMPVRRNCEGAAAERTNRVSMCVILAHSANASILYPPQIHVTMSAVIQSFASRLADAMGHDSVLVRSVRPVYETLLWWSSRGRGIPWTINGIVCRIDPRIRHWLARTYDP